MTLKLHMIGNAHIDPVWLWPWTEGFHEVKATFRSALDRMKEYGDFVFVSSSAAYYEWIEQSDPPMFTEIQQRIQEGRWGLVGGWWIEPDCNIPCGESFVRQALYAQRYFLAKFGKIATVGYNVDSFGHHGMLPQILHRSGLHNYVFMRPAQYEKELPSYLFWWESDDGSRVLTYRIPFSYATYQDDIEDVVRQVADVFRDGDPIGMCFYGVGNHGGGPTRENIDKIQQLRDSADTPDLIFSTPELFFEDVRKINSIYPVVRDDLQHHASGCYAAFSAVKRWNRRAENALLAAEKWSVVAHNQTGLPYSKDYAQAWKNVLFCQFHDILAGTSIESAYEDIRNYYGEALAIAGRNYNAAVQALAWNVLIEPEPGMRPILVFNPHPWQSNVPVEVEVDLQPANAILVDPEDQIVSHQYVQSESAAPWRTRLCFIANLPSLGYQVYRLKVSDTKKQDNIPPHESIRLENEIFNISFDPGTGCITSIIDKRINTEILSGPAAKPVVVTDPSDTWSHGVFRFEDEIGVFKDASFRIIDNGPIKNTIRIATKYNNSQLIQDFTIYKGIDRIEVNATIDWKEHNKLLKLRFPFDITSNQTTYEIPYGHINRPPTGEENPGQRWIDVTGTQSGSDRIYGVSILNDSKYSFDSRLHDDRGGHDIGMTVLRSPVFAHHMPLELEQDGAYNYMEQGRQSFRYAIFPHLGSWKDACVVQKAAEVNLPPFTLLGTYHPDGIFPLSKSYLTVDTTDVVISVLKESVDGNGIILRAYEIGGKSLIVNISLSFLTRIIQVKINPYEIKTIWIPSNPIDPVKEVNLLELVGDHTVAVSGGRREDA